MMKGNRVAHLNFLHLEKSYSEFTYFDYRSFITEAK